MTKKRKKLLGIVLALVILAVFAFDTRLKVVTYTIVDDTITAPIRLALLTDLHSCDYGENQQDLIDAVMATNPNVILLSGDMVDDDPDMDEERAYTLITALAEDYPVYYVTGNHEFWGGEGADIKDRIEDCGAIVLAGAGETLNFEGQDIQIFGIDDPDVGEGVWQSQFETVTAQVTQDSPSVLISHRPERVEYYANSGFDLVVAGHAHGGQWRIPGLLNGLIAPNQGLFPQYAGGLYDLEGGTTLVVSRGLARESTRIPRIFNRPELVLIDIVSS